MESNSSKDLEEDLRNQSKTTSKPLYVYDGKVILSNLIEKCRREMNMESLIKPLDDYVERVAYYSGISKSEICTFFSEDLGHIKYDDKFFQLPQRIEIFTCIANMYSKGEFPTNKSLFGMLSNVCPNMNYSQFQYKMNRLGFEYRTLQSGEEMLVEDPDLTFERYLYIKQISELKSKCAPIYFIDEWFVDNTYTFPKPWMKNIDVSSDTCDGYVFFHAVSKKGMQNGLFSSPTTKTDFIKWMTDIVMPQLLEPSIFVLDNNYLHKSSVNTITKYHSKEDMLQYLRKCNIPCNENLHKAELYRLIKSCSLNNEQSNIDEVVKAHGHQVLWLPSTFHDLSITHFLWMFIADDKTICNVPLFQLKSKLLEIIRLIPQYMWQSFEDNLYKLEKQIFDIDLQAYQDLETKYAFKNEEI